MILWGGVGGGSEVDRLHHGVEAFLSPKYVYVLESL